MAIGMAALSAASDPNSQKAGLIVSAVVFVCISSICGLILIWGKDSCKKNKDGEDGILAKAKGFSTIWGWLTCLIPCLIPIKCLALIMCKS